MNLVPNRKTHVQEVATGNGALFLDFGWTSRSQERILILPREVERVREEIRQKTLVLLPKTEERLDAFDENGTGSGTSVSRTAAHADGTWHNVVHIWLHDAEGNVFLQERSKEKKLLKGFWDATVGGHVSAGQTVPEAALRELIEEAWPDPRGTLRKVGVRQVSLAENTPSGRQTNNEFTHVYALRFDGGEKDLHVEEGEALGFKKVSRDELEALIRNQTETRFALPKYFLDSLDVIRKEILGRK